MSHRYCELAGLSKAAASAVTKLYADIVQPNRSMRSAMLAALLKRFDSASCLTSAAGVQQPDTGYVCLTALCVQCKRWGLGLVREILEPQKVTMSWSGVPCSYLYRLLAFCVQALAALPMRRAEEALTLVAHVHYIVTRRCETVLASLRECALRL